MQIANLQKTPMEFFGGPENSEVIAIPGGETRDVPKHIWERYATRPDIKAMDGVTIAIGGRRTLAPDAVTESDDRDRILDAHEKELTRQFGEVAQREAAVKREEDRVRLAEMEWSEKVETAEQDLLAATETVQDLQNQIELLASTMLELELDVRDGGACETAARILKEKFGG